MAGLRTPCTWNMPSCSNPVIYSSGTINDVFTNRFSHFDQVSYVFARILDIGIDIPKKCWAWLQGPLVRNANECKNYFSPQSLKLSISRSKVQKISVLIIKVPTLKINYRHAALINDNIRGKFTLFCLVFTSIQITDNIFPLNKFSVAFN